jgi:O-acetyl-ADP-ribose deacetylase (regulator of RNase III)
MIEIVLADITTLHVDAIVNAANDRLRPGAGVCGAIYDAAGSQLERATNAIGRCPTGHAVITPGFALPARFVIHAVGPVWHGGGEHERELLRSAYDDAFRVALEEPSIRSIAFPAISTGVYGFPRADAAEIAIGSMRSHEARFDRIVACLFDGASESLYRRILERDG